MKTVSQQGASGREPMRSAPIETSANDRAHAYLTDYGLARCEFSWGAAGLDLDGLPGGGVNIAHEAVDRHLGTALADATALRWHGATDRRVNLTYSELATLSDRFANLLHDLGVRRGERVALLLGRTPELYVAMLGAWKAGCVVTPLSSASGMEQLRQRLEISGATALLTTVDLYQRTIAPNRAVMPALRHVLVTDAGIDDAPVDDTIELSLAMAAAEPDFDIAPTDLEDPALLLFAAAGIVRPAGVVHVHGAVLAHRVTARYALDLRPGDIFWCTADPGSAPGISYGAIAALSLGATVISDESAFDARRGYRTLTEEQVSVWCTEPEVLQMLAGLAQEPPAGTDLSHLRFVASVGAPLDPDVVQWSNRVLGRPVHESWWQPETGAIMIANLAATQVRPGSIGRPLPGIEATILRRGTDGRAAIVDGAVESAGPGEIGELALRTGWPSMFRGYWCEPVAYARAFADGWYLSGDLARRDADGYYWFITAGS